VGARWWDVQRKLKAALPNVMPEQERHQLSYEIMTRALNEILGEGAWETYHPMLSDGTRDKAWVRLLSAPRVSEGRP
jgi:hypothetical protein